MYELAEHGKGDVWVCAFGEVEEVVEPGFDGVECLEEGCDFLVGDDDALVVVIVVV